MLRLVSKATMRRIRWYEPESDGPSTPVDWPIASLILATLFLNFSFFMTGARLWLFCPLPLYALLVGGLALLVTALFFLGPTLATHAARRPLFLVIADSLGSIPAFGLRLCCVLYLVLWIATLIAVPIWLWSWRAPGRQISSTELGILATALLAFLFVTGRQSLRTRAKLALFTNKLAFAILIAALIRIHEGWPVVLGAGTSAGRWWGWEVWTCLSELAFYVAPLALVAANFGLGSRGRRQVVTTGLMGVALPLFATLLLVGAIGAATFASTYYQPSLEPTVAMALWSRAAGSALPGRMMIAAVSVFGVARFGLKALAEAANVPGPGIRRGWAPLACFVGAIAWLSLHPYAPAFTKVLDWAARCLGVTGTVITVDLAIGKRRFEQARRIDWVGLTALLAGLATPWYVSQGILPSCFVGFLVCLCGRVAQKMPMVKRFDRH